MTSVHGSAGTGKLKHSGLFFHANDSLAASAFYAVDWARTSIGPIEAWTDTLKGSLNSLFHSAFPGLIWWGDDSIQIYNESFRKTLTAERQAQSMGQSAPACWPEIWREYVKPDLDRLRETGKPLCWENRKVPILRNGRSVATFWTYSYAPIYLPDGTMGGIHCVCIETTGALAAEQEIREARRKDQEAARKRVEENEWRLRIITDRLPAFVSYKDMEGRYRFINQAYCDWFGLPRTEIEGKTRAELVHNHGPCDFMRTYEERAMGGKAVSFEATLYKADGEYVNLDIEYLPDIDPDTQRVRGIVSVGHDVTERKKALIASKLAQRELALAKEAAETANATKSAFLANMSHEIRTPLGAILGFSEFLRDPQLSGHERDQYIHTISRNGQALTRIIDDILDLAKVEAGRLDFEEVDFSLFDLAGEVVDLFKSKAAEKRIYLNCRIEDSVPDLIASDPIRIRQILINIVGNAIKFTDRGGVDIVLRSRDDSDGHSRISIHVRDTGRGLTEEQIKGLFKPFTQADNTTTRQFGGTGLGLALSKRLCEALGGDITIGDYAFGKGCKFIISFVATRARKPRETLKAQPADNSAAPLVGVLEGMRILVVDDSLDNQFLITRLLSKNGARIEVASDGIEAVEKAMRMSFDVVLMDIQMPRMDGYEAIQVLQGKGYAVPVIALTAHAMKEERLKTEAAGFANHLTKPLNPGELISYLRQLASISDA